MAQFQTAQPTSTSAPTALPPTNQGEANAFSLDGFLALDATPVAGAPPQVLALAGKQVSGDGGFRYLVLPDGTFEVTGMPPGTAPEVMGRPIRPDNEFAAAWKKLCDKIVADSRAAPAPAPAPAPAAGAPPVPVVPAPAANGNVILDGIAAIGEQLIAPLVGAADGAMTWLDELLFGAPAPAPTAPGTPASPAPAAPEPSLDTNLEKALDLKKNLHTGYSKDPTGKPADCKAAVIGGDLAALKTINCGQFTGGTLAAAGFDLNTEYIDEKTNLPLAYVDGQADGKTLVTFVTAFMLVNCQREAVGAILAAQAGNVTSVAGDARKNYALSNYNKKCPTATGAAPAATVATDKRDFAVSSIRDFVGVEAKDGQQFGAGAVAQMFGGHPVEDLTKRMPGDIQQRIDVDSSGKFGDKGHSSTIYSVKGTGTCYYDPANAKACATPASPPTVAGWYTGEFTILPEADPAYVSRFTATQVQLIDANSEGNAEGEPRTQAIDTGVFKDVTTKPETESAGRLPTSKWRDWHDDHVPAPNAKPL